ncbi:hypothetical protein LDENG_00005930 [Lucifuga dentata]|nr:hypothetical protein LDENG_00005930 [Lucifuga dentata]
MLLRPERILLRGLLFTSTAQFENHSNLHPLQFAYQACRGVEDAILTLLHLLHTHLEQPKAHAKILFVDFSSVFNTMQPNILAGKLESEFSLDAGLTSWILNLAVEFSRSRAGTSLSDKMLTCTGFPPGMCFITSAVYFVHKLLH